MTRESVHQLRVCIASLLLGISAASQLRLFELPLVHPVICLLAAILLFPRPRASSARSPGSFLIALGLIVAINIAAQWWLGKTGQPMQDSPWFIVPLHVWLLYALSLDAAKTIRLLPASHLADGVTENSTHTNAS